jgi:hypothetical protein
MIATKSPERSFNDAYVNGVTTVSVTELPISHILPLSSVQKMASVSANPEEWYGGMSSYLIGRMETITTRSLFFKKETFIKVTLMDWDCDAHSITIPIEEARNLSVQVTQDVFEMYGTLFLL